MTTQNYKFDNDSKKKVVQGFNYAGETKIILPPSIHEAVAIKSASPLNGAPSSTHEIKLLFTEEKNHEEYLLEFDQVNLDATLSQIVFNPYLFLYNCEFQINDLEALKLDSTEKIFLTIDEYLKKYNKDDLIVKLQSLIPTYTAPLNGQTTIAGATTKWSIPLTWLFNDIKHLSLSNGIRSLLFKFRFQIPSATTDSIGRFMKSSTTSNPYTSATIRFDNIQMRILTTKVLDKALMRVPAPIMFVKQYDDKYFNISLASVGEVKRIQFSTEFTKHITCSDLKFYIYDKTAVNAYNSASACVTNGSATTLGFELKFRARSMVLYNQAVDAPKRAQYYSNSLQKRRGLVNPNLVDQSDNISKYFNVLSHIDLQNIESVDDNEEVHSGLPSTEELELIIYNNVASGSAAVNLHVALGYMTTVTLAQNGQVMRNQFM